MLSYDPALVQCLFNTGYMYVIPIVLPTYIQLPRCDDCKLRSVRVV